VDINLAKPIETQTWHLQEKLGDKQRPFFMLYSGGFFINKQN